MFKRKTLLTILLLMSLFAFSGCKNADTPPTIIEEQNEVTQGKQQNEPQQQLEEQPHPETFVGESEDSEEPSGVSETASGEVKQEDSKPKESNQNKETSSEKTEKSANEESNNNASLQVEGTGVDKPLKLSLDDLKAMKDAYFEDDFFSLNSYGTKKYFYFKGIKIKAILEKAGLKENAEKIKFIASDGYEQEFTIDQMLKEDYIDEENPNKRYPVIIAWHENGEDYDVENGSPFRLVIGQKEPGDVNKPQWVQNIAKIVID